MIGRDHWVDEHIAMLQVKNPRLYAVLVYADDYSQRHFDKPLMVTSIYRSHLDRNGIHGAWRAVDIRAANPLHLEAPDEREARALIIELNNTFSYGRKWNGSITQVAHLRSPGQGQDDTAPHVHMQVKGYGVWR